jgi:hypothetical protein
MINPKIVLYILNENLHYLGDLTAQVSLIIDAFPMSTEEIFHDFMVNQIRLDSVNYLNQGSFNNYPSINDELNCEIIKLLGQDLFPTELYNLWVHQNLLIVPLCRCLYKPTKEDWNIEVEKNFSNSLLLALTNRTYVMTKFISEKVKQEIELNHEQVKFL